MNPQECIFFEDNLSNLKTAKDFGMMTVLIAPEAQKTEFCDFCFETIEQALNVMQKSGIFASYLKNVV